MARKKASQCTGCIDYVQKTKEGGKRMCCAHTDGCKGYSKTKRTEG